MLINRNFSFIYQPNWFISWNGSFHYFLNQKSDKFSWISEFIRYLSTESLGPVLFPATWQQKKRMLINLYAKINMLGTT